MRFMKRALELAQIAFNEGEVPVGAVIVCDELIVAEGYNQTEFLLDPTAHAEILAIREACDLLGNWRLSNCTLYTTLEPCAMCAGAILQARLKKVVWAAPDIRCGGGGSWINVLDGGFEIHKVEIEKGLLADEASQLMKNFFKERRNARGDDRAAKSQAVEIGAGNYPSFDKR